VSPTVQSIAARAAELIREHGWLKGKYGDCGKGFCAVGAINQAESECEEPGAARAAAGCIRAIRTRIEPPTVAAWNDAQTSPAPILAVLDEIAEGR
jgi:hypothetical protein